MLCTIQKQANHLYFASWILAEGRRHETDILQSLKTDFRTSVLCPLPSTRIALAKDERFVFVLYVALKKRISLKFCIVLFVWLKGVLFNILCVFGSLDNIVNNSCIIHSWGGESKLVFSPKLCVWCRLCHLGSLSLDWLVVFLLVLLWMLFSCFPVQHAELWCMSEVHILKVFHCYYNYYCYSFYSIQELEENPCTLYPSLRQFSSVAFETVPVLVWQWSGLVSRWQTFFLTSLLQAVNSYVWGESKCSSNINKPYGTLISSWC